MDDGAKNGGYDLKLACMLTQDSLALLLVAARNIEVVVNVLSVFDIFQDCPHIYVVLVLVGLYRRRNNVGVTLLGV